MELGIWFPTACAFALIAAVALLVLREFGFRGAPVVAALCGVLLLSGCVGRAGEAISPFAALLSGAGLSEAAGAVLRIIGVGALASLTADLCEELGERTVGRAVSAAGGIEIFLLAFPYFSEAVRIGLSLLTESG